MCGIAGVVGGAGDGHVGVARMLDAIAHRGPDGRRITTVDGAVLGAVRLAIVDPDHGDQPMQSADGRVTAALNGELYGFRRLRSELPGPFHTDCDTELLPALYERHGLEMASHTPGMFAFAVWDRARRRLVCARDRFGEKPLFYGRGPAGELVFASEVKAVLASGLVGDAVDPTVLGHVVQRGTTPADRSVYCEVEVLPPAHRLVFEDGELRIDRYWEPPPPDRDVSAAEAAEELAVRLDRAVADQLVADVPVGAF
ncbi:MAG: asparagine synthetase B, partial [Actinomycetota bacterium]